MSGGFSVSAEQLSERSTAVSEVGASIRECAAAADEMGVGGLVYGVYFDPTMLPLLSSAGSNLKDLIGTVADAADAIAAGLRKNAETYGSVEQFLQQHFTGLRAQTGNGGSW